MAVTYPKITMKMSNINFISIYSLFCFVIIHTTKAVPATFQIDEFIDKLMSSDKFDELTDLIADKAAQKIKGMDTKVSHTSSVFLRKHEENGDDDDDHKMDEKIIFNRKTSQKRDLKFKQEKNKSKDSKSNEKVLGHDYKTIKKTKSGLIANNDHSDESKEKSREKYKDSRETNNDSRTNENRRVKNKKIKNRERNRSGSDQNKNNYARSREDKLASAEKSKLRFQEKQTEKSLRIRENFSGSKKKETIKNNEIFNLSEIDTQALLNNHMNSKELGLNFKHLKGEVQKRNTKESNIDSDKSYDNRLKYSHEDNIKETNNRDTMNENDKDTKNKRKNTNLQETSNENKKHEQYSFHSTENKDTQQRPRINDSHEEVRENEANNNSSEKIKTYKSKDKLIASVGNNSKEVSNSDEEMNNAKIFIDKVMERVSKELRNPMFVPKEVGKQTKTLSSVSKHVIVGLNSKNSEESEMKHSDSIENTDHTRNASSKRKISRVENGKQFTYQSSAEYAEYHEHLDNAPKTKYFNTY